MSTKTQFHRAAAIGCTVLALLLTACSGASHSAGTAGSTKSDQSQGQSNSGAGASDPKSYPKVEVAPATQTPKSVVASLRPLSPMPQPGQMPSGTYLREIQDRGRLVVCSYDDINLFAYADPLQDGKVVGFDMDVARKIAAAIFADNSTDRIQLVKISGGDRIPFVNAGKCDIVVATMTINATRITKVDFSEVYFSAGQRILVAKGSAIAGVQDLSGKRVCVQPKTTAADSMPQLNPYVTIVGEAQYTDCLRDLQEGKVEAIASDDVILAGLAAQDQYTKLVGPQFTDEPYGIAVSKAHPELTRFVNGVLASLKSSGEWAQLYDKWLSSMGQAPQPPVATYRD